MCAQLRGNSRLSFYVVLLFGQNSGKGLTQIVLVAQYIGRVGQNLRFSLTILAHLSIFIDLKQRTCSGGVT
jgi:hypothetical protein